MVIKGKGHFRTNLRVCIKKLDENSIPRRPYGFSASPKNSSNQNGCRNIKKETVCFFTSEVDLDEAERYNPIIPERTITCTCGNCSPYYEYKTRLREEMMRELQQENFNYIPSCMSAENCIVSTPVENEYEYIPAVPPETGFPLLPTYANMETQTDPLIYKYQCQDCFSEFNDEYFYEHHLKIHAKTLLECPYCNATFVHEKLLQGHVLLHMNKNVYECVYCSIAFSDKKYLIRHLKSHEKSFYRCNTCAAQFEIKKMLEEHEKSHKSTGQLIHVFRNLRSYRRASDRDVAGEILSAKNVKPQNGYFYECNKCVLKFMSVKLLNKHRIIHNRRGKNYLFVCAKCQARFKSNNHLQIHERQAHKE